MERDFLGLSSMNPIVVKEEFVDHDGPSEDSGFGRSSGVPWLFPNKALAFSQFPSGQFGKQGKNSSSHFLGRFPTIPVTEQCVKNKGAQLIIFYGGAVNVFDEITPEKAQAIIGMAGKSAPKVVLHGGADLALNSGHHSPISTDSTNPPPAANDDDMVKVDPPNMIPSASMISSVPLARKASLARFLEKRKERMMNAAPYMMNAKPVASPQQRGGSSSTISGAGSSSGKEITDDC